MNCTVCIFPRGAAICVLGLLKDSSSLTVGNSYNQPIKQFELGINFKDALLKTHGEKHQFCMPWSNRICKGVRKDKAIKRHYDIS